MDADPSVEPILDRFSRILPLPFRIGIILVCGVWAWGLNLQYLNFIGIDVPALIRYSSSPTLPRIPNPSHHNQSQFSYQQNSTRHISHHTSIYRLATLLTLPLLISLTLFWLLTSSSSGLVLKWQIIPQLYLLFFCLTFLLPIKRMSHNGRARFLSTFRRVSLGGLAQVQDGKFGDILLADVLTSYAKVLGDLFVSTCMLLSGKVSTNKPDRGCGGAYLVPLVISIPSLIRLRQCLIEFTRVRRANTPGSGWGGQHLANALKYASAFPVVVLSAIQRNYDPKKVDMSETGLYRLWLLFVLINSFYSFYWDVAKDWDLTLFSGTEERKNPEHPYGLRRNRYFHSKWMYYVAIVVDFFLRCTWSVKLSPHLDHFNDLEGGIFLMEFLEVVRRWMWIFFRVETEWVRNNRGPAPDDILLGEFAGGKIDED